MSQSPHLKERKKKGSRCISKDEKFTRVKLNFSVPILCISPPFQGVWGYTYILQDYMAKERNYNLKTD